MCVGMLYTFKMENIDNSVDVDQAAENDMDDHLLLSDETKSGKVSKAH